MVNTWGNMVIGRIAVRGFGPGLRSPAAGAPGKGCGSTRQLAGMHGGGGVITSGTGTKERKRRWGAVLSFEVPPQ